MMRTPPPTQTGIYKRRMCGETVHTTQTSNQHTHSLIWNSWCEEGIDYKLRQVLCFLGCLPVVVFLLHSVLWNVKGAFINLVICETNFIIVFIYVSHHLPVNDHLYWSWIVKQTKSVSTPTLWVSHWSSFWHLIIFIFWYFTTMMVLQKRDEFALWIFQTATAVRNDSYSGSGGVGTSINT